MNKQKQPNKAIVILMSIPWLDVLQTLLAILKLTNVIQWEWWVVLLPLWTYGVVYLLSIPIIVFYENIKRENSKQPIMSGAMGPQAAYNSLTDEEKSKLDPELLNALKNGDVSKMKPIQTPMQDAERVDTNGNK